MNSSKKLTLFIYAVFCFSLSFRIDVFRNFTANLWQPVTTSCHLKKSRFTDVTIFSDKSPIWYFDWFKSEVNEVNVRRVAEVQCPLFWPNLQCTTSYFSLALALAVPVSKISAWCQKCPLICTCFTFSTFSQFSSSLQPPSPLFLSSKLHSVKQFSTILDHPGCLIFTWADHQFWLHLKIITMLITRNTKSPHNNQ